MPENWKNDPDYDKVHARRYQLSREWINPHLQGDSEVLELGDESAFVRGLRQSIGCHTSASIHDLRYPWQNHEAAKRSLGFFDMVLCMEVLEHIHDQETVKPTEWRATGTAHLLGEAFEVLKPGGLLFLTTPNACSHHAIFNALTMAAPAVYRPHVREYAPSEVASMVKAAGFLIERFETVNCWTYGTSGDRQRLEAFTSANFPSEHRGDDIFVLARRPASSR